MDQLHRRGWGSAELVRIARAVDPNIVISTLALPDLNASAKILRRLGFSVVGNVLDPDAGEVWQWRTSGS
jgi:hypothetical protein